MPDVLNNEAEIRHQWHVIEVNLRIQLLPVRKKISPHIIKTVIKTSERGDFRYINFIQKEKQRNENNDTDKQPHPTILLMHTIKKRIHWDDSYAISRRKKQSSLDQNILAAIRTHF